MIKLPGFPLIPTKYFNDVTLAHEDKFIAYGIDVETCTERNYISAHRRAIDNSLTISQCLKIT